MLSLPASKAADKAKVAAYIAKYASETSGTITLEKIMTEKHKLMFTMEAESWMDVRRMNYAYPKWLYIPYQDETGFQPIGSQFIQRLLYPQHELDRNAKNVPNTTIYDKLPVLQ
ncbi:MAG TPA: SusD/RagB family nutrient-binding outer membrane lipoprotein, partial [Puia sp.]